VIRAAAAAPGTIPLVDPLVDPLVHRKSKSTESPQKIKVHRKKKLPVYRVYQVYPVNRTLYTVHAHALCPAAA